MQDSNKAESSVVAEFLLQDPNTEISVFLCEHCAKNKEVFTGTIKITLITLQNPPLNSEMLIG